MLAADSVAGAEGAGICAVVSSAAREAEACCKLGHIKTQHSTADETYLSGALG